jgi:hypothetical protein
LRTKSTAAKSSAGGSARDLSAVIDGMLADPTFVTRIDAARIGIR